MIRHVLLAEDDVTTLMLLEDVLRDWEYDVVPVSNGLDAWDVLQREDAPRLVVLDWMMPGMDGIELCRKLRALENQSYKYVILLTGKSEKMDVVAGLNAGADDFLTKPVNMDELRSRLAVGHRILNYEHELADKNRLLHEANDELARMANTDYLTGLNNRRSFMKVLEEETSRSLRYHFPMCVAILDLDHFKHVNDTYGHLSGDAVLRRFAELVRLDRRLSDIIGRYGGEEFCLLLPQTPLLSAAVMAERLRSHVESERYMDSSGREYQVTCSIGIAQLDNEHPDAEDLLRRADEALYQAKALGRNRVSLDPAAGLTPPGLT